MKRAKIKRTLAMITAVVCIASSLTGCGGYSAEDVSKFPLVNMVSEQEARDYYAKSLAYDAVISKNYEVHKATYELKDVSNEQAEKLKGLVKSIEGVLGEKEYNVDDTTYKLISEDTYNYVKASIDDMALTGGEVTDIKQALGYYFVDVKYNMGAQEAGTFKENVDMLGLNGVWVSTESGWKIDIAYLQVAIAKLRQYFRENRLPYWADYDKETGLIMIYHDDVHEALSEKKAREELEANMTPEEREQYKKEQEELKSKKTYLTLKNAPRVNAIAPPDSEAAKDTGNIPAGSDSSSDGIDPTSKPKTNSDKKTRAVVNGSEEELKKNFKGDPEALKEYEDLITEIKGYFYENSAVDLGRKVILDIPFINTIAGGSINQSSFLPELGLVYEVPDGNGDISGFGIYPQGNGGLKNFGFDRSKLSGTVTLRYVLKESVDGSGEIVGQNIYLYNQDTTSSFNVSEQNLILPDFLSTELSKIIERADRIDSNCDLPGYMNCEIYEDKGQAVLRGYKDSCSRQLKKMSVIRQVLQRDTTNNMYLLDVETTVVDGSKSADSYGTFKDKYYVVVQQQGDKFVISDSIRMSRTTEVEPLINPDTATAKRLTALNLSGVVADEDKSDILKLMSDLYTSGTNRVLNGPKEIEVNGEKVTIEKGMYDCFDKDTTMLSTNDLEYMNSKLRGVLIKHGTNTGATYAGTVTEWIGGYNNQAEFTTEELVTYSGRDDAHYMQVYYLVSKMGDNWVIDERTIIDEIPEVKGDDLNKIKSRIGM